jgi:hypothetical protein
MPAKLSRLLFCCTLVAVALAPTGCGSTNANSAPDSISGKVTLNGSPVAGQVVIVGSDKKEYPSPIALDGSYYIAGVPAGEARVLVKGMTVVAPPKGKIAAKGELPALPVGSGVAPPARYGTRASDLKVAVTGGVQKHDIALTP